MKMLCKTTLVFLAMVSFLAGCVSHDIAEVRQGMTKPEVQYLLGKPEFIKTYPSQMQLWKYGDDRAIVFFMNSVHEVHVDANSVQAAEQAMLIAHNDVQVLPR